MTFNPWPSSDWVAFTSERGFAAAIALALVFILMAVAALRSLVAAIESDEALLAATLIATIAATCIAGAFDAVLMLALPAFIVWSTLGALMPRTRAPLPYVITTTPVEPVRSSRILTFIALALALLSAAAAVRSATQIIAMELFTRGDRPSLRRAAIIDPGNYRVRMRLARLAKDRCRHALAARALYPNATAARTAARACD